MQLDIFSLGEVQLQVACDSPALAAQIRGLWLEFFALDQASRIQAKPTIRLQFESGPAKVTHRSAGAEVFRSARLAVFRTEQGFCLHSCDSALDIDLSQSRGLGVLTKAFWGQPLLHQREFFLLSLIMLLRRHGLFGLHANAVSCAASGILIIGASGCGKTTLSMSLIRSGWRAVADDALLLRQSEASIEALALRRSFACTEETRLFFPELQAAGPAWPALSGGKWAVPVKSFFPDRFSPTCSPRLLLFPTLTGQPHSQLVGIDETEAMTRLIPQSAGILADRPGVRQQLGLLKNLVEQARSYRLQLGVDVFHEPTQVSGLLRSVG